MPDPSVKSVGARVARYYRRCKLLTEYAPRGDRAALVEWARGRAWREAELAALAVESAKIDESLAYLNSRREGESLKDWRRCHDGQAAM
jgi:hypothetical protein